MSEVVTGSSVMVLVRDLMFLSRIRSAAEALGAPVTVLRKPSDLAGREGTRLIADLNMDGAVEAASQWKNAAPGRSVVGFVSHVDGQTIARARDAGVDQVMARGAFVERLPELLRLEL